MVDFGSHRVQVDVVVDSKGGTEQRSEIVGNFCQRKIPLFRFRLHPRDMSESRFFLKSLAFCFIRSLPLSDGPRFGFLRTFCFTHCGIMPPNGLTIHSFLGSCRSL
jgi:hypothetical protein